MPAVPPSAVHLSGVGTGATRFTLQCEAKQSESVVQLVTPEASVPEVHVPVVVSQLPKRRQFESVVQLVSIGASVPGLHMPVLVSHIPNSWIVQVSKLDFPNVERAAQRITFPLHIVGMSAALIACATQLTNRP